MFPKAITDSNVNETGIRTQDFDGGSGNASFVITSLRVLLAMDLQARLKVHIKRSPDNSACKVHGNSFTIKTRIPEFMTTFTPP